MKITFRTILLSLNRHIDRTKKQVLDSVRITEYLKIKDTISGVILENQKTGHACLVNKGWKYIAHFLDIVNELRSLRKLQNKYPDDGDLISILLLHRIIIPDVPVRFESMN